MKVFEFCICVLACISLASPMTLIGQLDSKQPNNEKQFANSCVSEAGMNYEDGYDVRDIINNDIEKPELQERTQKHGCIIECLLRKMTWMEGSELKEEKLYADINKIFANHPLQIQVEEFVRDCVTKVKHAPQERCEKGVVAMKCGVKGAYRLFPSTVLNRHDEEVEENENN